MDKCIKNVSFCCAVKIYVPTQNIYSFLELSPVTTVFKALYDTKPLVREINKKDIHKNVQPLIGQ